MYATRSLLGNTIPIKTKMDAGKASQFVFLQYEFLSAFKDISHTLFTE